MRSLTPVVLLCMLAACQDHNEAKLKLSGTSIASTPMPTDAASHADAGAAVALPSEVSMLSARPFDPLVAVGARVYAKYCILCHGKGAEGYAADNAPSLISPTFQATATDEFVRAGIERGRPGTAMAGYAKALGGPLGTLEVDALVAYLHTGVEPRVALPIVPVIGDALKGKAIFDAQCVKCHGTPIQRADSVHLANPVLLATASDAFLRHAVQHGRPGTRMEPWAGKLDGQQIDDVVTYVRSLAQQPAIPPLPPMQPALPRTTPIVLNPKGRAPDFHLRDDRFASLAEVAQALEKKRRIIIVDARAPSDWLSLRITGAISTPYYDPKSLDELPNDGTWIIAYCACPHHASGEVVDALRKRGYKHTAVMDEGVFAWQHAGHPVVTAAGVLPSPAPPPMFPPPPPSVH